MIGNGRCSSAAKLLSGDSVPLVSRKLRTRCRDSICMASPGMKHLHEPHLHKASHEIRVATRGFYQLPERSVLLTLPRGCIGSHLVFLLAEDVSAEAAELTSS